MLLPLLLILVPYVDSCLVIKFAEPPKCACSALALDSSNLNTISDNPFYKNVTGYDLNAPVVRIDDCVVTIFCEGDFNLVAFDKDTATDFGPYQIDGQCDPYSQTWQIADLNSGLLQTYTKLYASCVDFNTVPVSCTPSTATSLFLAYSNEIDYKRLSPVLDYFRSNPASTRFFKTYAIVRYDTQEEDEISWGTDFQRWTQYPVLKSPNPALSFTNRSQGSDVFKVIEKFLANKENQICGSRMLILMGSNPDLQDIDSLVQKLRRLHVTPLIFSLNTPPSLVAIRNMLFSLTSRTNGFCAFDMEEAVKNLETYRAPLLVYKANLNGLSGKGKIELPSFQVGLSGVYNFQVSSMNSLRSPSRFILEWYSNNPALTITLDSDGDVMKYSNWYISSANMVGQARYNCLFEYDFPASAATQSIQIRMSTGYPTNPGWLPYDD